MDLLRKPFKAIGIFRFTLYRWGERKGWGDKVLSLILFPPLFVDVFAILMLIYTIDRNILNSSFVTITLLIIVPFTAAGLPSFVDSLAKRYSGTKYDTDEYERIIMRRFWAFLFLVFIGSLGASYFILKYRDYTNNSATTKLYGRVRHSFDYEGTERDSIAAVSVFGAVDSLLEKSERHRDSARYNSIGLTELVKLGVLIRARRFDEARDYVSETDFAKDLDTPGCNDYLNLRIDFLENRVRGNGEALNASAREMHDYLLKQVAQPEFEMDSVLRYGVSADKPFAIRYSQLRMLKALTVCFKEPADTAELADRLRSLYPATEYQYRLTRMPDRAEAEKIVYSALPL